MLARKMPPARVARKLGVHIDDNDAKNSSRALVASSRIPMNYFCSGQNKKTTPEYKIFSPNAKYDPRCCCKQYNSLSQTVNAHQNGCVAAAKYLAAFFLTIQSSAFP